MFAVIFEVLPESNQWDAYLDVAKALRPELVQIDGFIDNIRYKNLYRTGWILSLSYWRNEKALIRWRTQARHHFAQQAGREEILSDYHLRVGELVADNSRRFDKTGDRYDRTEIGKTTTISIATFGPENGCGDRPSCEAIARQFGIPDWTKNATSTEFFDAVLDPGNFAFLIEWRDDAAAEEFQQALGLNHNISCRQIRVIRDYGKYDRREAPQYYGEISTERGGINAENTGS